MQRYKFINFPQKAIIIDNYCKNYEELTNNFPNIKSENHLSSRFSAFDKNFNYNKEVWVPFIKEHIGRHYLEHVCTLIEDHLLEWRPKLLKKIKLGDYTMSPRIKDVQKLEYQEGADILYDFKFGVGSNMQPSGKGTEVHVDFQNKIFQTMVYFPCIDDNGSGGDIHLTHVHEDGRFSNIVKCKYQPNRCLLYPHHPSGWHFVTARKSNFPRRGVGIIYTVKESLQEIDPKFFGQKYK
jgi:hypothetical protein